MARVTICGRPVTAAVEPPVGLNFGDVVKAAWESGKRRVYMVTVAPGTGGLKGTSALFTNLETGDIRSGTPVNMATLTETQLVNKLFSKQYGAVTDIEIAKADSVSIDIRCQ